MANTEFNHELVYFHPRETKNKPEVPKPSFKMRINRVVTLWESMGAREAFSDLAEDSLLRVEGKIGSFSRFLHKVAHPSSR